MNPEFKPLAELIDSLFEKLRHEMQEGFARIESRFDAMNAKLDSDLRYWDRTWNVRS
ncbi:MAG: hypothetical protein ACR2NN_27690 [Bryobacteraceae bacterium]